MIEKLRKKIFYLIFVSLSIIVLGVIVLFAFLNYRNTVNTAVIMMNRMSGIGIPKEFDKLPDQEVIRENREIDGIYNVRIENNRIIEDNTQSQEDIDETIKKYALEISEKRAESGIIGKYIYSVKKMRGRSTIDITLMENEESVAHANYILIISAIMCFGTIIIIYIGSKKISKMLVKPVEETFEKQKQFISDASHELKTPLAVIEANADVLENEVEDNKWIKYIQNEIESMNKLINELLMLAKIENIDDIKEATQIDLSKELEIIISMFESMAYEKNIKLSYNLKEDVTIKANKEDIEHIVSTLLDNAIKHTKSEGQVVVELHKEKNNVIIQVKNQGEPIPEEEKEKIFERFYRIDKSRNRKEKRYGLGLAIAKSTVQKYNGEINVSHKDGFTIFKVNIPI